MYLKLRYIFTVITVLTNFIVVAQSDGCSFATDLSVQADCFTPVNGTSAGATQTIPGCTGNADDDVWYQFTATQTSHQIRVNPSGGYDPVIQVFSGACNALASMGCKDDYGTGVEEVYNNGNFIIGNVYRIRVYHYGAGWGTGDFTICLTTPPPPPSNDNCISAQPLTVNGTCTPTSSTTDGASQSMVGCAGNADDDVWFSFVATNAVQTITVSPTDNLDLVVQLFSGSCGSLSSLSCMDNTFTGGNEVINAVGLTPGQTYFIRVYDYYSGTTGDFDICITGTPTATPTNDEPCDAILMPTVTAACTYASFTNVGATTTIGAGIPTPFSCVGGGGAAIGGFTAGTADVWFKIVVPASGNINITAQPNMGAGRISDGVMTLYSGDCNTMTQIVCADDHTAYPDVPNDLLPMISENGLTPGDTLYLRYWGFGTSTGTFGFCVTTAANDDCANALYICDINGYSASTGAYYTEDRPCNMRGNAEVNDPPTYTYTPGTNTGGIFGQGGAWGTGSSAYDVQINNNSWIRFTASSTTAVLGVSVYDCWIGNYPSGGIQMQVFSGNGCCDFVPVSNFEENSTGFTITANNLIPGNDYYLMVDGFAGDICNYTISAESGVQFPDIEDVAPICVGESVILTAPDGANSYLWMHSGETTQSVTVSPSTTITYECEVTGLCDYKQTLEVEVEVIALPDVTINTGATAEICAGSSIQLTASGATSYVWSTSQVGSQITVSPAAQTTYTVVGTLNGCENSAEVIVSVNSLPVLSTPPTATDADCGLSNGALTGAVVSGTNPFAFEWTNGASAVVGNALDLNGIPAGLYSLNVIDDNGCENNFGPFGVSNPGAPDAPTISAVSTVTCLGESIELTASSTDGTATFDWSGPSGFTSNSATIIIDATSLSQAGNYCVNATAANCTGPASCEIITINSLPVLTLSSDNGGTSYCLGATATLSVSGADTYTWSGPNGFNSSSTSIQIEDLTMTQAGWYYVEGIDANGCSITDSIEVMVTNPPVANAFSVGDVSGVICGGSSVVLNGSGGTSYSWTGPSGFTSSSQNPEIIDFSSANSGTYTVVVTDDNGCSDSAELDLAHGENNSGSIDTDDISLCPGETLVLTATGGETYSWTGPNEFSVSGSTITVTGIIYSQAGIYYVTAIDEYGCSATDSATVSVVETADCLFIPQLVTPNFDNHNDIWEINGIQNFPQAEVSIFNRWGNLIFFASPYKNDWEGQVNKGVNVGDGSGKVPPGTYYYIIDLNDGVTEPYKGYLELQY